MATLEIVIFVVIVVVVVAQTVAHPERYRAKPKRKPVAQIETRRPTVTRVAAGGLLGGPIGALIGFAWRKKSKQNIYVDDDRKDVT
jgi:hypothetical protein